MIAKTDRRKMEQACEIAAAFAHISVDRLLGKERDAPIMAGRHLAYWLSMQLSGRGIHEVATGLGFDRSTVEHGVYVILSLRERDEAYRAATDRLLVDDKPVKLVAQ